MRRNSHSAKRLSITLPQETVQLLDSVAGKNRRSFFINLLLRRCLSKRKLAKFRKQLAKEYRENADFDLEMANEWLPFEDEA
jgi:CopG family transcriptional regulator / antitoxin EndoAI